MLMLISFIFSVVGYVKCKRKYMWWLPLLCILIVIVVAGIYLPLATIRGVGGLTIMSGQLGPGGQQ